MNQRRLNLLLSVFIICLNCYAPERLWAQTFTTLYHFTRGSDGASPNSGLILSGSMLYGTAYSGGNAGQGTIFKIATNGTGFTALHSFAGGGDGANPNAGLVLQSNTLYGTTVYRGTSSAGTVFKVNENGTGFTNVFSFAGAEGGANPLGGVIILSNILYGTACHSSPGAGTAFALNTDGAGFTNLYNFTGQNDGGNPTAGGQSAAGFDCDLSGGKFGPFEKQLFVGDQTHSTVMRVFLEKVNGRYQGACFPFKQGFGSGVVPVRFGKDGSLFAGGTNRGWGSRGPRPFSVERLAWTGKLPFEVHEMRARPDGFELTFTKPLDAETAGKVESYKLKTFTYIYRADYGSPEVDPTTPDIKKVEVAKDRKSVRLYVDGLQEGHIHDLALAGVRSEDGQPLLHPQTYYTLNYIPSK